MLHLDLSLYAVRTANLDAAGLFPACSGPPETQSRMFNRLSRRVLGYLGKKWTVSETWS